MAKLTVDVFPALSTRMIERIFRGAVTRGSAQKDGRMSYTEFVWFLLSEEDKVRLHTAHVTSYWAKLYLSLLSGTPPLSSTGSAAWIWTGTGCCPCTSWSISTRSSCSAWSSSASRPYHSMTVSARWVSQIWNSLDDLMCSLSLACSYCPLSQLVLTPSSQSSSQVCETVCRCST